MKKILIGLLVLITNIVNAQKSYEEFEIIEGDTIISNLIKDTTKISYYYRISFNNINNKFDSNDLLCEMKEIFKTITEFDELFKQFVFTSNEDITELIIRNKMSNYELSYFKKIKINNK